MSNLKVLRVGPGARISKQDFFRQQTLSRIIVSVLISLSYMLCEDIDRLIKASWEHILTKSNLFKHDSFEPILASCTFFVVLYFWFILDYYVPYFHKYRVTRSEEVSLSWKGRESVLWKEGLWYLGPLLVIDYFIKRKSLPVEAPTLGQVCVQIFLALFTYDLLFFCGHMVLHKVPYLYKAIHAEHHHSSVIRAGDTIRHTFVDGTFDVICSVLALNLTKAHYFSRSIYNIIAVTLITEAHCGYNFPWMLHNILPFGLIAGPVAHDLHHRSGRVNFQKYFTYLDYLFGTLCLQEVQAEEGRR